VYVGLELPSGSFNVHLERQRGESITFARALSQTFERASSKGRRVGEGSSLESLYTL
jgi:hypothetical protein